MFWNRHKPDWYVDPSVVAYGSVAENRKHNLSRSHVKVRYRGRSVARLMPVEEFVRQCREHIRDGRALRIEHLLVAPILKRRYATFFDDLTDWGPADRRARPARLERGRSKIA